VSLISVIGLFEGALQNFVSRLLETHSLIKAPCKTYKGRLEWAFEIARQSKYGNQAMQARIPDICLDVDHARRIRNLWMHNNGLLDDGYSDAIPVPGRTPILDPVFQKYQRDKRRKIPVILTPQAFLQMYKSHVELLHHLQDTIQRVHFGQKRSYGYKALRKQVEWHRLLIGK